MNGSDPHDDRDDGSGRRSVDRTNRSNVVSLGINVGIQPLTDLLGGVLSTGSSPRRGRGKRRRADEPGGTERAEPSPREPPGSSESADVADEFLVDTHRRDDEFVVTAELPGVDEDDLSVGIDVEADELVIAARGATIDRVALPWSSTDAEVWFNNGVLEVRLRPDEDVSEGEGQDQEQGESEGEGEGQDGGEGEDQD